MVTLRPFSRPVFVTKPMLPPLSEVSAGMERIYQSGIVTNMGGVHQELELKLKLELKSKDLVLFNNGTIALVAALAALKLPCGSEVITTPFSFAATTHAIASLGLKPVFADIDPVNMTIDPAEVRKKITDKTSCIVAVHVYGFPCNVEELRDIGEEHNIKIVYDAAHAFGTTVSGRPISDFGDLSAFSFHATKLFNTIEGGCVTCNRAEDGYQLRNYRNFGIRNEEAVDGIGLNGKMSEFHALFGLLNLSRYSDEMAERKAVREIYLRELADIPGLSIPTYGAGVGASYQYFPIRIDQIRDVVYQELKDYNVFSRRYFYPLISNFEPYRELPSSAELSEAKKAASEVLCLPFYGDLVDGTAAGIAYLVRSIFQRSGRYRGKF